MVVANSITIARSESLFGRGFDRIDRPPRSLLSLWACAPETHCCTRAASMLDR